MVCSDVGARGLDICECDLVIHYDISLFSITHVHRSGRTARAGKSGISLSLLVSHLITVLKTSFLIAILVEIRCSVL